MPSTACHDLWATLPNTCIPDKVLLIAPAFCHRFAWDLASLLRWSHVIEKPLSLLFHQ